MHKLISATDESVPLMVVAAETIRSEIVRGSLEPGMKLKVQELQRRYGYSSTPIREALNQLSREGFVGADARRGFRVAPASEEDFADITRLRLMIDVAALRSSIEQGDDGWEANVVAAYHRLAVVEKRLGDKPVTLNDDWSVVHKNFHMQLMSESGSPRMADYSSVLFDQAERYRRLSAQRRPLPRKKNAEHKAIMDAALARDADRACELLTAHITATMRNVKTILHSDDVEQVQSA